MTVFDRQGRNIHYLRISVTDRCNLRCRYCMPRDGIEWLPHKKILSYEQLVRITALLVELGVDKVRLTGGEPLVRKGLDKLVRALRNISEIREVALTTNGLLLTEQLPKLVDAGLSGVNISLDTLDREQFKSITRCDELPRVLAGLQAALAVPGFKVKINCVPIGENDDQLVPLAALARDENLMVRFIELMPIGLGADLKFHTRSERQVLDKLEAVFGPAIPESHESQENSGPARYVTFQGFLGKIGFISSMSHQFCASCNRVRLTSSGFLKTCLQYEDGVDLKALLDTGTSDEILLQFINAAIFNKPLRHHFAATKFEGRAKGDEQNNMNMIGG